jgi:hypothetical protein
VSLWIFLWLMLFLKIPVVALYFLVRWAIRQTPEEAEGGSDGGIGPRLLPSHPRHPRGRPPRAPRRGPHGDPRPLAPHRMRTVLTRRPIFVARQLPSTAKR